MPIHNTIKLEDRVEIINQDSPHLSRIGIVKEITAIKKDKPEKVKVLLEDTLACCWLERRDLKEVNFKYSIGDIVAIDNPKDWWHEEQGTVTGFWFISCQQYWLELDSGGRHLARDEHIKPLLLPKALELLC
jgi:hypothetical protein